MSKAIIFALLLWLCIAPALAQAPPPVPALPDTERRTAYTISGTTCACAVNFALYGDGTDYQNWVEVWLNGILVSYNDPTFGWTVTSPTGPLGSIARPITDAVLTFTNMQTGTVQIVGARRPRRTTQFQENTGVPARNLNQVFTDLTAQNREVWDKLNDVTGRGLFTQPGNVMGRLPPPAQCADLLLGFDPTGLNPVCVVGAPAVVFTNQPDQVLTGGANVVTLALPTGNVTVDCGLRPIQSITNGGTFTITAPANDGSCLLLVTNNASAGAISFSGFSVGPTTGDGIDNVSGHKFTLFVWRAAGIAGYRWASHQ